MKKKYFKPVTEIIEAEYAEFIAHSLDEMDSKGNNPDEEEGDIWNPHYNIWDN